MIFNAYMTIYLVLCQDLVQVKKRGYKPYMIKSYYTPNKNVLFMVE